VKKFFQSVLFNTVVYFTCQLIEPDILNAHAAQAHGISAIEIRGHERIERETILSLLGINIGDTPSSADLDEALKRLFNVGYFADAKIFYEGQKLVVHVVENPIVNQLAIEGNDKISDELLKSELSLRPRQVYTQTRLKNDAQRIQDLYRLKGYFAATVTPKIIKREQNRVDVIFEVQEGEPTIVRKIFFVGNKHFNEAKLESVIQTKETRWYRFFTSDDNYDPDRLAYDRELLRKFYLEHGYVDFVIKSAVAELSPDRKEFFITFTLEEGDRYKIGKVNITSTMPAIDLKSLESYLTLKEEDWYSSKEIERTITRVTDALGVRGFAFVEVKPKLNKHKETQTVDVTLEIQEGPRVYIDKIIILGNERTDEEVLRRELRFYEGDPYNSNNVKISERRLKNLGFFKKVDIKREPSDAPDKVNIMIEVEEERTGEISLGAGFSTTDGPVADVHFAERNFRGKGNEVEIGLRVAKRNQEYNLYFSEPYFMDKELEASIRLFKTSQKKGYDEAFDQRAFGGTVRFSYYLTDYLIHSVHYTLSQEEVSGLNVDASKYIREIEGRAMLSSIGHVLSYDRRDSRFRPTEGYVIALSNEYAGLGGQIHYLKNKLMGAYVYSFSDDVVLQVSGTLGNVMRVGRKLRVPDRVTLGGDSIRGFEVGGISPRDARTKEALGGTKYYLASAELTFPIGLPNEFNVKGAGFVDAGNTFDAGLPSQDVIESRKLRAAVGFGIRWDSPMGPVRIDLAKALLKAPQDKQRVLFIGFSTRF
jgi:outer membrane protein insertion porin family